MMTPQFLIMPAAALTETCIVFRFLPSSVRYQVTLLMSVKTCLLIRDREPPDSFRPFNTEV